jgi:hypothetical protein
MTATQTSTAGGPSELSLVVIQLMKGPLYRDSHERLWDPLLKLRSRVADYVGVLGLRLEVDESDGYSYLRSLPDGESEAPFPRLVVRHTLPFHVSLLLALLRKRLAEFDASSAEARLVLSRDRIVEMLRLYLPASGDEVKTSKAIDGHIRRVEDFGFLQRLRGSDEQFEVRRILRAFVDGQWLSDFDRRLAEYVAGTSQDDGASGGGDGG